MSSVEDNDLVRATLQGDRAAFDELVDRHQMKLFNMALRITGNKDDALDVSQTAFLKAYDNLKQFKPAYRFFSWIYRIAMNEALDLVNRRRALTELKPEIPQPAAGPEARYWGNQAGRRLQAALMELKPPYRAVIVLRHLHGLSYREISDVVGAPERTVKSRLFTARQQLRVSLTSSGVTP
jgi:RNA polymerase sigma-70 factor (ECF subfamily)